MIFFYLKRFFSSPENFRFGSTTTYYSISTQHVPIKYLKDKNINDKYFRSIIFLLAHIICFIKCTRDDRWTTVYYMIISVLLRIICSLYGGFHELFDNTEIWCLNVTTIFTRMLLCCSDNSIIHNTVYT